ncbi:MAG: hypothetical protein II049_04885 [Clostridia bacterium]|nr:hypothetical protein [Clostridia bacterium]
MKRLLLLLAAALLLGCSTQEAHLIYLPESTPTPVPMYTPTPPPEPQPIHVDPVMGEGIRTDVNGIPILDERMHYYEQYITVSQMRIYEENGETLIDALITNDYPGKLSGGLRITFKQDGVKLGYAEFRTASGDLLLLPGENRVYADVLTEVDVQMMDFTIDVTKPFLPES